MSEDSSSSDDSLPLSTKKRPRIIPSTSDSSEDSDVPIRRRKLNRQRVVSMLDESSDNEDSSDDSDTSTKKSQSSLKKKSLTSPCSSGNQTDSSDGGSDKCPICLLSLSKRNIGTPENCEHLFCADCITEWSKNVNTCPVDRLTFNNILVRYKPGGKIVKTIPVSPRRPSEDEYFIVDTTYCEICHLSTSEETMLLCDSCDLGYHMHCLRPPLTEVPETEWFCPRCVGRNNHEGDEYGEDLIHALDLSNSNLTLDLMSHIIDATTQTLNRINRVTQGGDPAPSTSGSTSSRRQGSNRWRTRNNTITRRRNRRRNRARTRTVVVEYESRDNGKFPIKVTKKRTKRKRKTKASRRAARTAARRALVRSSVRGRLEEQLVSKGSNLANPISTLTVPKLSVLGNSNELEYFEDSDIEDYEFGSGRGNMAVAVTSRSIASAILDSHRQVRRKMVTIPSPTYASTAPDILSSILESQILLHSKKQPSTSPLNNLNEKSQTNEIINNNNNNNNQVDLRKQDSNLKVKETPGYPGGGGGGNRGSGNWRSGQGGYQAQGQDNRGNYSNISSNDYQGNRGQDSSYQGNRSFNSPWQNNNMGGSDHFQRREQLDYLDRSPMQRNTNNIGRGRGGQMRYNLSHQRTQSLPTWHNQSSSDLPLPFSGTPTSFPPSLDLSNSNPVDMTTSQDHLNYSMTSRQSSYQDVNIYQSPHTVPPAIAHSPLPPPPQPPIIRFQRPPLSEDERSDTSQTDEPDKYDPTEPTLDDSGSEEDPAPRPINIAHNNITIVSPPRKDTSLVPDYGSGNNSPVDTLPSENKSFVDNFETHEPDVSDGCPNFSIYSSTMDIIKNKQCESQPESNETNNEKEEDLVQEEDDYQYEENEPSGNIPDFDSIPVPPDNDVPVDEWADVNKTNDDDEDCTEKDNECNTSDKNLDIEKQFEEIFEESSPENKDSHDENVSDKASDEATIKDVESNEISEATVAVDNDQTKKLDGSSTMNVTPQKRNQITIKLLSNRGISKNILDLHDKDDSVSLDISGLDDSKVMSQLDTSDSNIKSKQHSDNDETNTSADEEVGNLNRSTDFPDNIEKLTECISDVEDERSYTPCLDEKTKDHTDENDKDNIGIEGLDTEMISEDEGNDIFSDLNNPKNDSDFGALEISVRNTELQPGEFEEGEIVEKRKQKVKEKVKALLKQPNKENVSEDERKKRRRDKKSEKDGKDKFKNKSKKNNEENEGFKKLSKNNKERNYRDRDDKSKNKTKDGKAFSKSPEMDKENKKERDNKLRDKRREKKKDIERYDVRSIITEKGRRVKDAFGRDTSRVRSMSPDSPQRLRRSVSRRRSPFGRRSISRGRRSVSRNRGSPFRLRRSLSRRKQSLSPVRRSLSKRRRSDSRGRSLIRAGKSISPRRSISPRQRRSMSPRPRKMRSPRRKSISRERSPFRKRSISPNIRRSKSPKVRRSLSGGKLRRAKGSPSGGRKMSPRHRRDSPPPRRRLSRRPRSRIRSISKNRSVSPKVRKSRKINNSKRKKSKSPLKLKQKRRRSRSFSPGIVLSRSPSPRRNNIQEPWPREKSPLYREWSSGSHSMSPPRASPGWTPPIQMRKSPQPDNLRVILTTKDKLKKKERKKKANKRLKANERAMQQQKDSGPCKEVFTSGNNILVSVSFNKNQELQDGSDMPPTNSAPKKKKHKNDSGTRSKKDKNKEKLKKRRAEKNKKSKDKKPVAIIDLDKSPFKELTPSPKAVIILSDSENGEKEEELIERQEMIRGELLEMGFPQCVDVDPSPRRSPVRENVYVPPAGPKTPPEPAIKFTITTKSNPQLRAVNPLHEDEEETAPETNEEKQETDTRPTDIAHKGPNTPPEPPNSPPSSPDVYDPFEPTRSASATPERPSSPQPEKRAEDLLQVPSMSLEAAQKSNLSADDVIQARPISPMEKVLALLKSTRNNLSPANTLPPLYSEQIFDNVGITETDSSQLLPVPVPVVTVQSPEKLNVTKSQVVSALVKPNSPKLIYSTVAPTMVTPSTYLNPAVPRIPVYNTGTPPNPRIILPSPTKSSPLKLSTNKLFVGKPSPIKSTPIKPLPSKTIISKLPMPAIKPLPPRTNIKDKSKNGQNGNDVIELDLDMDSPYSPGSSDFGDLFDPPADNGKHSSNTFTQNKGSAFDNLFSSKPSSKSVSKSAHTKVSVKKKSKGNKVGVRMDEDCLRILDDLPSSAVELQVKTKFLKKLNRQERVVEEVKLVLKPHYSKKHISKEDYKEILRRAVPKICHSKSGEINPAKIHNLIEAYVRKFRKKALMLK